LLKKKNSSKKEKMIILNRQAMYINDIIKIDNKELEEFKNNEIICFTTF